MLETPLFKRMVSRDKSGFFIRIDVNSKNWPPRLEELVNMKDYYDLIILSGEPKKANKISKKLVTSGYDRELIGYSVMRHKQVEKIDGIGFILAGFYANSENAYYNNDLIFESTKASRNMGLSYITMATIIVEPWKLKRPTEVDVVKYIESDKMLKYVALICDKEPDFINIERGPNHPVVPDRTLIQITRQCTSGYVVVSGTVQQIDINDMLQSGANAVMIDSELENTTLLELSTKIEAISRIVRSHQPKIYNV